MSEEKKKKRKTAEDIAKEQNVSDTDTSEEEKANAKKLHAVKCLKILYLSFRRGNGHFGTDVGRLQTPQA